MNRTEQAFAIANAFAAARKDAPLPGSEVMNDKHELTVRTWLADDHKVIQEIGHPLGEVRRTIANVAAAQSEAKFREALIALGWIPPEEAAGTIYISEVLYYMCMTKPEPTAKQVFDWLLERNYE